MKMYRIDKLFNFEKGVLQSSKCEAGKFNFITAAAEWKTHKEYSYDCEALVFAAAASGSLGRTHYVNGKFIASDLCFIIIPKDPNNFPIDLKFYHIIFNEFKKDIVKNTKSGTSKEAIGLTAFGKYELPYFKIEKQIEIKNQFVNAEKNKDELESELSYQHDLLSQLRQTFLKDAIQGKLVKQVKKEGNAIDLLRKIKVEKEKLIAEKKLRKEKEFPKIEAEEIPFDIPNSWVWCRLGEITTLITDGKHGDANDQKDSGYYFLSAKDIQKGKFIYDDARQITYEDFYETHRRTNLEPGDLCVVNTGATIGKTAFAPDNELTRKTTFQKSVAVIKVINSLTCMKFVEYFIINETPLLLKTSRGSAINNLLLGDMKNVLLPFPPLAEQKRIVKKLEEVLNLCQELKATITDNQNYTDELLQVALKDALQMKKVEA